MEALRWRVRSPDKESVSPRPLPTAIACGGELRSFKRRARQERDWKLFAFLTTEANDVVRPKHEKAMPVILVDPVEQSEWLGGGEDSLRLQRPLPNAQLEMRETVT
jgi:putative SOS response-associated peptidase YedK